MSYPYNFLSEKASCVAPFTHIKIPSGTATAIRTLELEDANALLTCVWRWLREKFDRPTYTIQLSPSLHRSQYFWHICCVSKILLLLLLALISSFWAAGSIIRTVSCDWTSQIVIFSSAPLWTVQIGKFWGRISRIWAWNVNVHNGLAFCRRKKRREFSSSHWNHWGKIFRSF